MKKIIFTILIALILSPKGIGQKQDTTAIDLTKIEKSLTYKTGKIEFPTGHASLNVPKGYKFLDGKQTQYVLKDLWGNPEDTSILGAILPEKRGVLEDKSWMFVVTYNEEGFIKDDDADDINYDDLLVDMKEDIAAENIERAKTGYDSYELVGWASKPYYDSNLKVLHWAKEMKFAKATTNTLNYDLRVLGRKGMFNISAVANMSELAEVKASIPNIVNSVQYENSYKYSDFDSSTDNIAAWTIGGLVAGKVLAKVGFFAIFLKYIKFILIGLAAAFGAVKKFLFKNKDQETTRPIEEEKDEIADVE
jgi:uncharacterized membrane-anchored protein